MQYFRYVKADHAALAKHITKGAYYVNYVLTNEVSFYYNKFITTIYDSNTDYDDDFLN